MSQILLFFLLLAGDYLSEASAILEKDITHIAVDRDFSYQEEKEISIFILTYRGRETFGNLLEKYNKETEEITILNAKTQKKTGEEIIPDKKAIGDLSTVEKFLAPKYANSRIKSIAFSAVEESSRIILHSKKNSKEKKREFFGGKVFQKEEPVVNSQISLKTPFPIKYQTIGGVKVKEEKSDGYFFYQFSCCSLPRIKTEPGRVAISEISPRVYWTNLKDWKEVGDLLKKEFYQGVVLKGDLVKKAKELARGKKEIEIIQEVYDYVTKNWRDIPLTLPDAGFKPTRADEVYKQKYADNKDKCLLLLTMLKAVGITAYPGYVAKEIIREIPAPVYFYYMVCVLKLGDSYIFLDPTFPERRSLGISFPSILTDANEGFPLTPEIIGDEVFLIKPDTLLFLSLPTPEAKEIPSEISFTLFLDPSGNIKGKMSGAFSGMSAMQLRADYKDKTEKEKEIKLRGAISAIKTGIKLKNWEIENLREPRRPVKVSLDFEAEKYGVIEGNRMRILLFPYLFFDNFPYYFTLAERNYPLDLKTPASYLYRFEFSIPEGYKAFYQPADFEFSDSLITLKSSAVFEDTKVKLRRELYFHKRRYHPKDYWAMKKIWRDFAQLERNFLLLEKK